MYTVLFACKIALENFIQAQPTDSVKQRVDSVDINLTSADFTQFTSPDGSVNVNIVIRKENGQNITSSQQLRKGAISSVAGIQVRVQGTSMN
jgi:hypothetical protein